MAFGISGFAGEQTRPKPQVFQALSFSGAPPQPPAPPYGTPNQHLVPVSRPASVLPTNLTLAAQPTFQAILHITSSQHPLIVGAANSTASLGATNPAVTRQVQGQATGVDLAGVHTPQGAVSFGLTVAPANVTSGLQALQQTTQQLGQAQAAAQQQPQTQTQPQPQPQIANPPAVQAQSAPAPAPAAARATGTTPPVANPSLVNTIVTTLQNIAIGAVYPGSIFSFTA